jgi:hypothetical protein|tara:strand:- start:481 stop:768 length:288 start_codon:yes stop_codon:yes gene_type:complete
MSVTTNNPEALGWKYDYVAGISTRDGVVTEWPDSLPELTQDLVDAAEKEWDDKEAYKGKRKTEYPSIQDQLDDIYHNGIDEWKKTIKVTKDKYPK